MSRSTRLQALVCVALLVVHFPLAAQRRLKVYISADMEGIAGVVSGDQLAPGSFEYERFRGFMTSEVLAAIQGARDAGATDFVVSDSHGNGENILIEKLPSDVVLVRSWPRPNGMMEGIDSSFAAAFFVGYHASSVSTTGIRAHTISSARITAVALNGTAMPEAGLNAAIAGYYGVPIALITGDDAATDETRRLLGDVETAVVKRSISFHAGATITPDSSQALIRARAKAALLRLGAFKPFRVRAPVQVDLSLKSYRPAELLAYLPNVRRVGSRQIQFTSATMPDASRMLEFITHFNIELEP